MNCRFCGKSFNRGFNLRRYESEYCPLQDHNSSIEYHFDQSVGLAQRENMRTMTTPPQKVILIIQTIQMTTKGIEDESDPWARLTIVAVEKNVTKFEELWQNFTAKVLKKTRLRTKHV